MNLETTVQRQEDLNYRLNDFTIQLRTEVSNAEYVKQMYPIDNL